MFWPILLIAASAILKMKEGMRTNKRQEALANAMRDYQASKARDSEQAINQLVDQSSPQARSTEMSNVTKSKVDEMNRDVSAVTPQATNAGVPLAPEAASYKERSAQTVSDRTKRAIEQMAAMQAPAQARQDYGIRFGRTAGKVGANTDAIRSMGDAYATDIGNVKNNPYVDMLSQIGMSVGGGMLAGGYGASAGANYGQGLTDASDNLYNPNVTTAQYRPRVANAFSIWGR